MVLALGAGVAQAETPTEYVKSILNRAMAIQTDPALAGPALEKERARLVHELIEKNFDFPMMAKTSLGSTFERLSAGQRREFTDVFSYLFQNSYTRLVLNFLVQENVKYNRESPQGEKAEVDTTLLRKNETIPVNYLMHRRAPSWVLYDVIVDGVSILENYRTQFGRVIQTQSFEVLLDKMKTQMKAIKG
jgi:phospholipid transport system substrate-binding protein